MWQRRREEHSSQRRGRCAIKCFLLHTAWLMSSWTHSSCGHLRKIKPAKFPAQKGLMVSRPHPFTEELLAVDSCQGGRLILLCDVAAGRFPMFRWMPTFTLTWAVQTGQDLLSKNKQLSAPATRPQSLGPRRDHGVKLDSQDLWT